MSVVFKKVETSKADIYVKDKRPMYRIEITLDYPTYDPDQDLKMTVSDIIEVMSRATMENRDENFRYLLTLLENMAPDIDTYKEIE